MPLKKNSPGCICCSRGIITEYGEVDIYHRIVAEGESGTVSLSSIFGETMLDCGIDIERKYILARKASNGEMWMYDPYLNVIVGKLWNGTADIGDPAHTRIQITYVHSWGVAYGIAGNSSISLYAFSLDSSGNYIQGPFINPGTSLVTSDSSGNVMIALEPYYSGPGGHPYRWGIYVNSDITNSSLNTRVPTYQVQEIWTTGGPASAMYTINGLVHDGTNLYLDITSYADFGYAELASTDPGINTIDNSGNLTHVINMEEITGEEYKPFSRRCQNTFVQYNPLRERFEGWVRRPDDIFTSGRSFRWYAHEEGKFIFHFYGSLIRPTLATGPPLIEDIWDVL